MAAPARPGGGSRGPHTAAFTGAVLCGGSSRRMGQDKALLVVEGVPMARRVASALEAAGAHEVLAIGGDPTGLSALGLDHRPDRHPGDGPLGATLTALAEAASEHVLVAGCDLLAPSPQAMAATVAALAEHPGAVGAVPVVAGRRQWVHAAWHQRVGPALQAAFDAGERSLERVGATLLVVEVSGLAAEALADADEPGDLP